MKHRNGNQECYDDSMDALDTTPEMEWIQLEGYRRMSAGEKLKQVGELTELLHRLAISEIRRRHPDCNELEGKLYLASRWISADLMKRAFNWDPEQMGF